jgi:hypothetical protein
MPTTPDTAELRVKFEGENLAAGTIDVYDLANTMLAIGQTVDGIAKQEDISRRGQVTIDVTALRPGSFETDLMIKFVPLAVATAALIPVDVVSKAKAILEIFNGIIDIRKFLKGEKPASVVINQNGANSSVTIINVNGESIQMKIPVYNALQNKQIAESTKKIFAPLSKEGSNVDAIKFTLPELSETEVDVLKAEVAYFVGTEELQITPNFTVKGIISAFDRKTSIGRITLDGGKRPFFEIDMLTENYESMVSAALASLKHKLSVHLTGEAALDFSSNLKRIKVDAITSEAPLDF